MIGECIINLLKNCAARVVGERENLSPMKYHILIKERKNLFHNVFKKVEYFSSLKNKQKKLHIQIQTQNIHNKCSSLFKLCKINFYAFLQVNIKK